MPADHRRILPVGLTGLAALSCVACCAIPLLLAAGLLGGATWVTAGRLMPAAAVALVVSAAAAWWATTRHRHTTDCADDCTCHRESGGRVDAIVHVGETGSTDDPGQFKLDVVGAEVVEQPPALTEQHRHQVDFHIVEQSRT